MNGFPHYPRPSERFKRSEVYLASPHLPSSTPNSISSPSPLLLTKKDQIQNRSCQPSDIWKAPIHPLLSRIKGGEGLTPRENGDFVNRCGVYAKCQLKPLGSFILQCWLAHRAQKRGAEETSRKTIPEAPAVSGSALTVQPRSAEGKRLSFGGIHYNESHSH